MGRCKMKDHMSPCKIGVRNQKSQSSDANVTTSLTGDSMLLMPGIPFKVHLKQVKLCVCVCMYINQKDKLILKIIIMSCGTCPKFFEVLSFRKAIEPCPSRKNLPPPCRARGSLGARSANHSGKPPGPVWQMAGQPVNLSLPNPCRRNHETNGS